MIEEAYVSFETAKLLKEKGFNDIDCECHGWIGRSGKHYSADDTFYDDEELKKAREDRKDFIPLTTLQMAMRWLREEYKLAINIRITCKKTISYVFEVWDFEIIHPNEFVGGTIDLREQQFDFKSYEEAVEAALKYVLENLI